MADGKRPTGLVLWGSMLSRASRVHWMLHELELDYACHPIGPRTGETQTPEFLALNPRGKIPVLQDGDLVLAESAAILNYLGEKYGPETGLVPAAGTLERVRYDEWCFYAVAELDAHTLYVIRKHRDLVHLYGEAPNAIKTAQEGFANQVQHAERALADGRQWLLGSTFTAADILLALCLDWARAYKQPLAPVLSAYADRATAREAYRAAVEREWQ